MFDLGARHALFGELAVVVGVCAAHMSMPNHWLPYALMGIGQGWPLRRALLITFCGALAHMLSTLTAVLFVSGLTGAVLSHDAYRAVSSLFLLGVGGYYLYNYFVRKQRGSAAACCAADGSRQPLLGKAGSAEEPRLRKPDGGAGDVASALALVSVTALSPCVGSMPVLLAVLAPPASAARAGLAGGAMLAASCAIMLPLVACAYAGASRLDFARIRRHERLVLGVAFVVLAAATFTVLADHDDDGHVHGGGMHGEVVRQGVEGVLGKKRGCH